jgi:hypothetical protein
MHLGDDTWREVGHSETYVYLERDTQAVCCKIHYNKIPTVSQLKQALMLSSPFVVGHVVLFTIFQCQASHSHP